MKAAGINLCRRLSPCESKTHFRIANECTVHQAEHLSCAASQNYPGPAQRSTGFLKPSSDDEDSTPAWKKRSGPVKEVDSVKKQQEKEKSPEKTRSANQGGDKVTAAVERYCNLT